MRPTNPPPTRHRSPQESYVSESYSHTVKNLLHAMRPKFALHSGIKAYPTSGTKQSSTAEPRGLMARETPFLQDALRRKNSSQSAARLRQRCCPCLEKRRQGAFLATRKVPWAKWAGTRHRPLQSSTAKALTEHKLYGRRCARHGKTTNCGAAVTLQCPAPPTTGHGSYPWTTRNRSFRLLARRCLAGPLPGKLLDQWR